MPSGRSTEQSSLGPYEIRASLGRGGGGEVYRAWDPRLERDVALKILHEQFENDPERVRRFVAEARAASALNHPNIVTVYDAAVDGGTPYIVSELVDGRPLRDELGRGPVPLKRLLDLATQIADGLAAAHDAAITHRDLKPENIMVTRTGRVKILDFGLARAGGFQTSAARPAGNNLETQTEAGLISGTVPYMSPEQARGLPTDFHSDQFSFGLILYEMAAGRRAFRRETSAETLDAIINDELPPMSAVESRAPVLLRWIIERCLAKDPGDRYGATADLHRDLRTLRDRLAEAVPGEMVAIPPGKRWWRIVLIAAGAAGLVAAGTMLPGLTGTWAPPDMSALRFRPLAIESAYEGFPAWSPNGDTIAYVAEVNGTLQIFTRGLSASESAQITRQPQDCRYPFWSPDGQRIYYVSLARDKEAIWSIGATGGTAQVVVLNATRGAISPDNRTLAFLRDEARVDIVGTAALWLATPAGEAPWSAQAVEAAARQHRGALGGQHFIEGALAFSPDGTKLGMSVVSNPRAESGWQFWIVTFPEGREYRRLERLSETTTPRISSFTWQPDSRHVVLGMTSLSTPGSHLWMADLDRDRAWPLTQGPDSQSYPSASSGGDQVVFADESPDYDLVEISLAEGGKVRTIPGTTRNESDPEFSPNGLQFAYVTDRRGQDEIWLRTRQGQLSDQPLVTQGDFGADRTLMLSSPAFSPDGQRIAYLRNGYKPRQPLWIWTSMTARGQPAPLLSPGHEAFQGAPTWSPGTGEWIAYAEWQNKSWELVKVRVGSAGDRQVLRSDGVANATPRWSPTGEWITWETEQGFMLVTPDGARHRPLSPEDVGNQPFLKSPDDPWLVHTWSHDGTAVIGIKETANRRLSLVSQTLSGKVQMLADLGPSPPVNNPVRGLSVSADGRKVLTSMVRLNGDLWLLEGLQPTGAAARPR
jgi:eukaryotic-like serine/threonine-protein kinase